MKRFEYFPEQREALERLQLPFAVYQYVEGRIVTIVLSDGFLRLFGYEDRQKAMELMDHDMYRNIHPDDAARISDAALRFARGDADYDVIYRTRGRDGRSFILVHARGVHVPEKDGVRLAHVSYTDEGACDPKSDGEAGGLLAGAIERSFNKADFFPESFYDHLTGLQSMSGFFERVRAGMASLREEGARPSILFIDLSGMKYYNSKYGFSEGDRLLRAFARLLSVTFGSENCARIGSDHFAVLTDGENTEDVLRDFFASSERLNEGNSLPVRVGIYPDVSGEMPVSEACDRAKSACDTLRNTYGSCYGFFSREMKEKADRRQYILSNFDRALKEKWITVYYQPIVRAVTGRVCDEEALARWIDPVLGFLSPGEFIPFLEDAGLIYRLDLAVLEEVLEKIRILRREGLFIVPQSINLSRSDFESCDIVEEVRRRVDDAGVGRDKITIEITESILGGSFDFMREQIERFQALGFSVWMDDFGSGYSSLDVLQSIRFNLLKFDMSFLRRLDDGLEGKIILTQMMKMATSLGVDTICEGVETIGQVRFLKEIGCSKLQGYYYTRPIPLRTVLERYEKGIQIGFENPKESSYFETIGRVNLYDYAVIAGEGTPRYEDFFNALPIGILQVQGDKGTVIRSNQALREFMGRYYGLSVREGDEKAGETSCLSGMPFMELAGRCEEEGGRILVDRSLPDGSCAHSLIKKIGENPLQGASAFAVVILSVKEPGEGADYSNIARALASDYYNFYYVDLRNDSFIEYRSPAGEEKLAVERHGEHFFEQARRDTSTRIYGPDREAFLRVFTRETVLSRIEERGVFTAEYRLIETGEILPASMKISRLQGEDHFLIIGVSVSEGEAAKKNKAPLR